MATVPHKVIPALLLLAVAACQTRAPEPPAGVVLILVDALRADHLGSYGYARQTSPRIDALAAEGTRFAHAVSPAPWTLPAMGTLWTSLYPSVHGATAPSNMSKWMFDRDGFRPSSILDDSRTTFAEVAQANGFHTAAFVDGSYPSKVFGFGQGFEHFVDGELPGTRLNVEALLAWLDQQRPQRFLVYLHTVDVHSPYRGPQPRAGFRLDSPDPHHRYVAQVLGEEGKRYRALDFDSGYRGQIDGRWDTLARLASAHRRPPARDLQHLIALYDQGIAYTDYWIGQLIDGLKTRGLYDRTIVIVTADHGDEFFDHGGLEHSKTFYDEMMHVPLVIRVPGEGKGRVIDQQVGLIDLMPTLCDCLAIPCPKVMQGISLRPALHGAALPVRPMFGEASHVRGLRALRTNEWKYIQGGRRGAHEELYDLHADPRETTNVCRQYPQRCRQFRQQLQAWERQMHATAAALKLPAPPPAVIDAAMRERLRALGYTE